MPESRELAVESGGQLLPATLTLPDGPVRKGLIPLHGASEGHRSFALYEHLAQLLPQHGVAVLRYDRRPSPDGRDIPLELQAQDAKAATDLLRSYVDGSPIGLWGFSQGAWAAPLAAATYPDAVAFVIAVSSSGVSPAAQMRYGTVEHLRRHGFGSADQARMLEARAAMEDFNRGRLDRTAAESVIDSSSTEPWFPLAYLKMPLSIWRDMDFDPYPIFARLTCPVLAIWGETDEWSPIDESVAVWRHAQETAGFDLTIRRLPGSGHTPQIGDEYRESIVSWLDAREC